MVEQDIGLGPEYGLSWEQPWPTASKENEDLILEKPKGSSYKFHLLLVGGGLPELWILNH